MGGFFDTINLCLACKGIWTCIERSQRRTGRILAPQEDKHVKKSETASPLTDTREGFTSIKEIHVQARDTEGVTVTGDIFKGWNCNLDSSHLHS